MSRCQARATRCARSQLLPGRASTEGAVQRALERTNEAGAADLPGMIYARSAAGYVATYMHKLRWYFNAGLFGLTNIIGAHLARRAAFIAHIRRAKRGDAAARPRLASGLEARWCAFYFSEATEPRCDAHPSERICCSVSRRECATEFDLEWCNNQVNRRTDAHPRTP